MQNFSFCGDGCSFWVKKWQFLIFFRKCRMAAQPPTCERAKHAPRSEAVWGKPEGTSWRAPASFNFANERVKRAIPNQPWLWNDDDDDDEMKQILGLWFPAMRSLVFLLINLTAPIPLSFAQHQWSMQDFLRRLIKFHLLAEAKIPFYLNKRKNVGKK